MDANTKSLLKHTLMGLIGGGALSSLYALKRNEEDMATNNDMPEDIVVPLSRKNYLKAVRGTESKKPEDEGKNEVEITDAMTPADIAALKRSLLKKRAESKSDSGEKEKPESVKKEEGPETDTVSIRKTDGDELQPRDADGRFACKEPKDENLSKEAGVTSDIKGTIGDYVGAAGGFLAGMAAVKALSDRIMVNRKKRQVENARRTYANMLVNEVNDNDLPYYGTKAASDRGTIGTTLGLAGLAGLATSTIAGMITYKIIENRRKAAEKEADKDMSRYPIEKSIKFRFADSNKPENGFFA